MSVKGEVDSATGAKNHMVAKIAASAAVDYVGQYSNAAGDKYYNTILPV